ncbi:hypothetical protein JKF63_01743 [Porcisia hertigi]|uniref:Uncharacterized protein n=1 Tax=Porcisia hertigi TaxID=2761500 RepID=A0A836L0D3_9TRYP|nr:hypothetical protein JKF63_01743 [Porcisia hertigi]
MRSLILHRAAANVGAVVGASPVAQLRRISCSHRPSQDHALRWCSVSISRVFTIDHGGCRGYSTTAVLLKQHQPTNTGASVASPRASGQANHKQARQKAAVDYSVAGGIVKPALDTVSAAASIPLITSSSDAAVGTESGTARSVLHRMTEQDVSGKPKTVKRGRRKQGTSTTDATRCASIPSPTTTSSLFAASSRKRHSDAATALPPLDSPTPPVVESEPGIAIAASSTQGKKRGKHRWTASSLSSDGAGNRSEPAVTMEASTLDTAPLTPSSLFGLPPPVYYTHNMIDTAPRTEEQRIAERSSITKLIMVSGSVSFLFTALPRSEEQLKMYVKDLNRAQAPAPNAPEALGGAVTRSQSKSAMSAGQERDDSSRAGAGTYALPALSEKQFLELRQRLCAEQLATNTVFIHVREMEQLVPPLHLQLPSVAATDKSETVDTLALASGETTTSMQREGKARGRRGRRRGSARAANSLSAETATSTPLPTLSPVERILALQAWKKEAVRRAEETQSRYLVPAHYHAITRVRFHDPHQTDLTVAMGSGWCKSIESVLRAIVRSMPQDKGGLESGKSDSDSSAEWLTAQGEEDDVDNTIPPFPIFDQSMYSSEVVTQAAPDQSVPAQPRFLTSPYAVRPLLTVCASCVPRREAWIGTCAPGPSTVSASASGTESRWRDYSLRAVPTVPRYSTRITIMLEHDDMDPSDLVSLAEISTTRKPSSSRTTELHQSQDQQEAVSIHGSGANATGMKAAVPNASPFLAGGKGPLTPKKPLHLYCLVQDAGEY